MIIKSEINNFNIFKNMKGPEETLEEYKNLSSFLCQEFGRV